MRIIDGLRERVKEEKPADEEAVKRLLREEIAALLRPVASPLAQNRDGLTAMLIVGVNGAGKTTTIGKLAHRFRSQGKKVIIGAADTFRAAAIEQLQVWGDRTGATVIAQQAGADPAAVAFDAAQAAQARGADVLMVDTAGRLQTRSNLMEELSKVHRVLVNQLGRPLDEVLLVLDATTGQNGLSQARLFREAVPVSGIALTKLDGTAKGGVIVAIAEELKVPVKLVGVGEQVDDLQDFDPEAFAEALLA
ncbi:MAG: signal recognition particle-docking protein FtsY [Bacillota bacterium]|nr:MAG: signal recognition particle-docking protein FtsY [Bacillota bacterium]